MKDTSTAQAVLDSAAWITPAISAAASLLGVVVGAGLTHWREYRSRLALQRKDAAYLAVTVLGELDRFVAMCADVVRDDGLCRGQTDRDGCRQIQAELPSFAARDFDVEWRSLPKDLMFDLLDFPNQIRHANGAISFAADEALPPDFEELFEERQYQYAILGLAATTLAGRLREHAKLPRRDEERWDARTFLEEHKNMIEERREARSRNFLPLA